MEKTIKKDNITEYYIDDELVLTITELGNNNYIVENSFNKLEGFCRKHDEYHIEFKLNKHQSKGKNGRLYNTKKLFNHNSKWFVYILQQKGFVPSILPIY